MLIPDEEYRPLPIDVANDIAKIVVDAMRAIQTTPKERMSQSQILLILSALADDVAQYTAWRARQRQNEDHAAPLL